MQIIRISVLGALLLLLSCAWGAAQDARPRLEVFAEGGASILNNGTGQVLVPGCPVCTGPVCPLVVCAPSTPTPVTSTFSKTGRLFVGGRLRFTRHDALEASYSWSPARFSIQEGSQSVASGYTRVDLISFNYVRYLSIRTHVQPFATVGVGTNRFSGGPSAVPVSESEFLTGPDNGWQFAWNYGGGADVVLQRHLALRFELRDYLTGQPGFITGTSHNIVPSAGVVFKFR